MSRSLMGQSVGCRWAAIRLDFVWEALRSRWGPSRPKRQAGWAIAEASARGNEETASPPRALAEFAETWWATRSGHRLSTQRRDRGILDVDVLPFFGQQMLCDITPSLVQAWVRELSGRLAPAVCGAATRSWPSCWALRWTWASSPSPRWLGFACPGQLGPRCAT
jgi:hypothetical protein